MVQPKVDSIREKRIKAGYSMRELARRAGVHYATISYIEKHGHGVTPSTAKAICDALKEPFDNLFTIKKVVA